jgi:YVTN family beta-propeller protein
MNSKRLLSLSLWLVGLLIAVWGATHTFAARNGSQTTYLPMIANGDPAPFILATIPLPAGSHPHGIALDPINQRAFVGNHHANTLSILNTAAFVLSATIPLPNANGPNGVAYHPTTQTVYVANRNSNNVSFVNPQLGNVFRTEAVGELPDGIIAGPSYVYVANFGSNTVSAIWVWSLVAPTTIPVGSQPAMFAADTQTGMIYLSAHGSNELYYLNDTSLYNTLPGVPSPYGVAFDPITQQLYAANRGSSQTVTVVNVNPNHLAATISIGQEPYIVAANPRTGHLFVSVGNAIKVYDRRDHALITTIPLNGTADEGIAVDPTRNLIYVTSGDADLVTVIQDTMTYDLAYAAVQTSDDAPIGQIIVSDDSGRHLANLTNPALLSASQPAWRPDGRTLLYTAHSATDPTDSTDIWQMETGGANQVNLTNSPQEDTMPAWSPDGSRIVWRRDFQLWLMDANGENKTQLTPDGMAATLPVWSPNGQWIAFSAFADPSTTLPEVPATRLQTSGRLSSYDIFIIPAVGGDPINLSNNPATDISPSWSADSLEIAYESDRDGNYELYKANIAALPTITTTRLTTNPANDHAATWSPNGTTIAFLSDRQTANDYQLYRMEPDGSSQQPIAGIGNVQRPLAWSPDSQWIAAQVGHFENAELYKLDIATGRALRLTTNNTWEEYPVWRPDTW